MMHSKDRFRYAGLFALVLAVAIAAPASGSTFVHMELPQLVEASDAVIEGRVVEVESFWDEKGTVIVTEAVIQVADQIAGHTDDWIRVRTWGGEVDGYTVEAPGFPTFDRGERLVLFVHRPETGRGALRVTGYQLGKYRVVEEAGRMVARPTVDSGAVLLSPGGGRAEVPRALTLDRLKEDIRDAARTAGLNR